MTRRDQRAPRIVHVSPQADAETVLDAARHAAESPALCPDVRDRFARVAADAEHSKHAAARVIEAHQAAVQEGNRRDLAAVAYYAAVLWLLFGPAAYAYLPMPVTALGYTAAFLTLAWHAPKTEDRL